MIRLNKLMKHLLNKKTGLPVMYCSTTVNKLMKHVLDKKKQTYLSCSTVAQWRTGQSGLVQKQFIRTYSKTYS